MSSYQLITIKHPKTGKPFLLWGLKRTQKNWKCDFDYVKTLVQSYENGDNQAGQALLFLNAYACAEYYNSFVELQGLGVNLTENQKTELYLTRNSFRRDYFSNESRVENGRPDIVEMLTDNESTIGSLIEGMRKLKAGLIQSGTSISEQREARAVRVKKPSKKALPVKVYSKEERAVFAQSYVPQVKKVVEIV